MSSTPSPSPSGAGISPLWAVLLFTFANSLGGGVVTTGFSFLADSAYGFSAAQNYGLGLLQGVLYIVAALTAGPIITRLESTLGLSHRHALAAIMVGLGILCILPFAARRIAGGTAGAWALWLLIGGYSALTGALWPIVESYMSGGRRGRELRRAAGVFNVTWSSALVFAFWVMGPLKRDSSLELVLAVGLLHLGCVVMLPLLAPNPAAHVDEAQGPVPAVYPRLLGVFRMQLVTSYMVFSAITPFLPLACADLRLADHWQTPLASVWLAARVLTFAIFQCWHGWHGRWTTACAGAAALIAGFIVTVLAPSLSTHIGRMPGIVMLTAGLSLFGIGMGTIYSAAIYYALSVGNAQVDAGGKHEALIGLGYGAGPVCGLLAILFQQQHWLAGGLAGRITRDRFEIAMLILVALLVMAAIAWSLIRAAAHAAKGWPAPVSPSAPLPQTESERNPPPIGR